MSSSASLIPHLRSASSAVNLSTLQAQDRCITRVLFTAKHVVLYHLGSDRSSWQRQEVEGPLFVVERLAPPFYQLMILNRKSMTDWKAPLSTRMAAALETQQQYLYFQSDAGVVTALWFHEQAECDIALALLKQICPIANQQPSGQSFDLPSIAPAAAAAPAPSSASAAQPASATKSKPAKKEAKQKQQQQQQQPQASAAGSKAAPAAPSPSPSPSAPASKTYNSPYAPPPQVELNVALSGGNDRDLAQRLNGFLSSLHSADVAHTKEYESERRDAEAKQRENAQRFAEEEKQHREKLMREAVEEHKKKQAAARAAGAAPSPAPSSSPSPPPSISPPPSSAPPFPTMLSHDQQVMLQAFMQPANTASAQPQPIAAAAAPAASPAPTPAAAPAPEVGNELERNLAAAKARKAARAQQQQAQAQAPQAAAAPFDGAFAQAPQAAPQNPPNASNVPLSLLFSAAHSGVAPPMPTLSSATSSPVMRPAAYPPMPAGTPLRASSPILGPVVGSVAPTQQPPPLPTSTSASASDGVHPLLAMLSQSVANSAQPLPPMPVVHSSPPPSAAATAPPPSYSAATISSSTTQASSPTLLSPHHFLTAPATSTATAPSSTAAPPAASQLLPPHALLSSLSINNTAGVSSVPSPQTPATAPSATSGALMSESQFKQHILSLCNDPATFSWLYQRYLSRPNQHPFA